MILVRKPYVRPSILHTQKIEARATNCAKEVGTQSCETDVVNS